MDKPCSTLGRVGFSRRLRRQAAQPERARPWRRGYFYKEERLPSGARVIVPISSDAPYEERDARFWNWVLLVRDGSLGTIAAAGTEVEPDDADRAELLEVDEEVGLLGWRERRVSAHDACAVRGVAAWVDTDARLALERRTGAGGGPRP